MRNILLQLITIKITIAIIAYDCGHERMNRTTISLLRIDPCLIESSKVSYEEENIQLLQLNEVASTHFYQCKINILQTVHHCGMFSHLSMVPGGLSTFIADISQEECTKIHEFGSYKLQNGRIIAGIKPNSSTRYTEVIAGTIDSNGNCEGASYTFGANSWSKVIVIHAMEFTITNYDGIIRLDDNQVLLRNNIVCPYLKGKCIDPEFGMTFWKMIPDTSCETLNYEVLYQGNATKIQNLDVSNKETHTIYTVSTGDVIFALEVVKSTLVCHHNGYQTEHPRLVIIKKTSTEYWFKNKLTNSKNLDLFTYINSKFVYVERHIKTQLERIYNHLIHKKCEIEREVLRTQLAVAHYHPPEFALIRLKEPGHTAVTRGEVVYLIKCQAVETTIRKTERCFNELPVSYNNKSYFMAPTTHLLQEYGTEIPCSSSFSPAYFLHGAWYGFNPHSHRLDAPEVLRPAHDIPWRYEDQNDLIKSGIYSFESTDELRRQIMYPAERQAIENVLAKSLMGHDIDQQNINVLHMLSPEHLFKIRTYFQESWSFITQIGNVSAAILGIVAIIRMIKYVIDVVINIRIIKNMYGWSWWIFAATWNTLTTYLIHRQAQEQNLNSQTDTELNSVVTVAANNTHPEIREEQTLTEADSSESIHQTLKHNLTLDTLREKAKIYPSLRE